MNLFQRKVKLPITTSEFENLVTRVVKKYELTDRHHAAAIISVAIRHLPNTQAYTTLEYLGHSVLKNIANYVANHKGETLRHESQIAQLVNILTNDPNNLQAFDELTRASNEGSEQAKAALAKLFPTEQTTIPENVTSIKQ